MSQDELFSIVDDLPDYNAPIITKSIYITMYEESTCDIIKEWFKKNCLPCCLLLFFSILTFACVSGLPGLIGYGGYLLVLEGLEETSGSGPWIIFGAAIVFICACFVCVCGHLTWACGLSEEWRDINAALTTCIQKITGVDRDRYYRKKWNRLSRRKRLDYCLVYYSRVYEVAIIDNICKIMNGYLGRSKQCKTDYYYTGFHGHEYGMCERDRKELAIDIDS